MLPPWPLAALNQDDFLSARLMCAVVLELQSPTILAHKYLKKPHGEVDFGKFFVWDPKDNNYPSIIFFFLLLTLIFIDVRQKKIVIFLLITFSFEDYEQSLEEKQS